MTAQIGLIRFFRGDISKEVMLKRMLPTMIGIMLLAILISNLIFPTAYDWRYMVISALTNAEDNPQGFWVLSSAMAIMGILLIPFPGYFQKRLGKICRFTASIGTFFFILGSLSLILTGILFEGLVESRTHVYLAAIALAGLVFGCFFYGWPMIKDRLPRYNGKKQFDFKLMIIGFCLLWFAFIGMSAGAIYLEVTPDDWGWMGLDWIDKGAPVLASFALWEWILFYSLLIYLVLFMQMVPEKVEPIR